MIYYPISKPSIPATQSIRANRYADANIYKEVNLIIAFWTLLSTQIDPALGIISYKSWSSNPASHPSSPSSPVSSGSAEDVVEVASGAAVELAESVRIMLE